MILFFILFLDSIKQNYSYKYNFSMEALCSLFPTDTISIVFDNNELKIKSNLPDIIINKMLIASGVGLYNIFENFIGEIDTIYPDGDWYKIIPKDTTFLSSMYIKINRNFLIEEIKTKAEGYSVYGKITYKNKLAEKITLSITDEYDTIKVKITNKFKLVDKFYLPLKTEIITEKKDLLDELKHITITYYKHKMKVLKKDVDKSLN